MDSMVKKIFDKHPQDRLHEFLKTILKAFYPDSYHELSHRKISEGFSYLANLVVLSVLILALLVSFNVATFQKNIELELTKLDSLEINFNLKQPIVFEDQNIVVTNEGNYTNENFLITNSEVIRKPTICAILRPACLIKHKPVRTNFSSLPENSKDVSNFFFLMLLLMLPGLLLVYLIYFLIKSIVMIIIMAYAAKFVTSTVKFRISFKRILMTAIYASTIFILLEPINLVIWNLYYIHILLSVVMFIIGVMLIGENKHRYHNV